MTAKDWLRKAQKEKFAIGAFNAGNLETFRAVAQAAANKRSPVIIESSPGETKWMGADNVVDIARNFSEELGVPILLNLDHAETLEDCLKGIEAGYDLIHFDGSSLSFDKNIEITIEVVKTAHTKGLLVEAEIDRMARKSSQVYKEQITQEELRKTFSSPEKVLRFVEETGVDTMATLFGNIHGIFPHQPPLDFALLKRISEAVPYTFLSLHGSSGIPHDQVRMAIQKGIVKVNLNTEMRQAFKDTLEKVLQEFPEEYAMYKIENPVIQAVQKIVEEKLEVFGSVNKA